MPWSSRLSFSLRFPHHNTVLTSSLPHTCHMTRLSDSFWSDYPNSFWWGVAITELLTLQYASAFCYPVPLGTKSISQRPILTHTQPVLTSVSGKKFMLVWNSGQNYRSLSLNPCTFGEQTRRHKILDRNVASALWTKSALHDLDFFCSVHKNVAILGLYDQTATFSSLFQINITPVILL